MSGYGYGQSGFSRRAASPGRRRPPRPPRYYGPNPTNTLGVGGNSMSGFGSPAVGNYLLPAPNYAPTYAPPTTDTTFSGGTGGYDPSLDPSIAQISALTARLRASAQAAAAAKTAQAALEYGDPSGVKGLSKSQIAAAKNNPFSIVSNLKRNYDQGVSTLEDQLNKANLFYSGYRGKELGNAATQYQQAGYDAGNRFRGEIADINDSLAQALFNADMMDAQAAANAQGWDGGSGSYGSSSSSSSGSQGGNTPYYQNAYSQGPKGGWQYQNDQGQWVDTTAPGLNPNLFYVDPTYKENKKQSSAPGGMGHH